MGSASSQSIKSGSLNSFSGCTARASTKAPASDFRSSKRSPKITVASSLQAESWVWERHLTFICRWKGHRQQLERPFLGINYSEVVNDNEFAIERQRHRDGLDFGSNTLTIRLSGIG